ncbi:putative xylosidase/arabinosidase [Tricladium varicosporioides]|nr:putative xylosidase/arabinosidase [Hymenoscyphus varicosporioides]
MKFVNPIIPGFAPDPSVVFVEGTFFLVNSSFHIFPGLPIYASKDLNTWTQIGNAINRTNQLDLDQANIDGFPLGPGKTLIAAQGLLAPTIRWHKGIFYVICTNSRSDGKNLHMKNFYVSTENIWLDEWSDPIWFDFQGIDPSLFFDDNDRAYIQGSWRAGPVYDPQCTIRQLEIDIKTGNALSETKEIWKGFAQKQDAEGPHIYKKDGIYYLIAAEAGTFEHHMITVARSSNIWGPYESHEENPILCAFEKQVEVQHTGHGDIFQDGNGGWWAVALGVRNRGGRYPLGRETFLMPVSWPEGGWPTMEHPTLAFEHQWSMSSADVEISVPQKQVKNVFIRNCDLSHYDFTKDGTIKIQATLKDLSTPTGTASFVGQRQKSLSSRAAATLQVPNVNTSTNMKAGLAMYKENYRHCEIYYDFGTSSICSTIVNKLKGEPVNVRRDLKAVGKIDLQIKCTPDSYELQYMTDAEDEWILMGEASTLDMTAYDFTGPLLGIFATSSEEQGNCIATFENFKII